MASPELPDQGKIFCILSDGTGETAEQILRASLLQFYPEAESARIIRFKNIRKEDQVSHVISKAKRMGGILVHTLVSTSLRKTTASMAQAESVPLYDLMGPLLGFLSGIFGKEAENIPGLMHQVNAEYFDRINAIEFTVKHDDGKYLDDLDQADVILVGVSRTSKTPLSVFLSHKGYKVANIPIVNGIELPKELFKVDQRKIVALEINPDDLMGIRRNRLSKMGAQGQRDYASEKHIVEELQYAQDLFRRNRLWPVLNVTGRALEETALEIEKMIERMQPRGGNG